ncbi:S-layer homology domain-containing protein [Halobacillus sp. K22]|uniref:S-layer homology domain-containing protein n=1 Tax=Halobacillus sp. K22 TaxID=3457431 RepID=UPI003FCD8FC7
MKKHLWLSHLVLLSIYLIVSAAPVTASASFTDIEGHWAYEEINYLIDQDLFNGYPDGTFKPSRSITRAEASKVIAEQLGLKPTKTSDFPDINGHWAEPYIKAIEEQDIIIGFEDGEFKPNYTLRRSELAVILTRAYQLEGNSSSTFTDLSSGHWAFPHVSSLLANHITTGYEDGTFRPSKDVTRAEFSSFLARIMDDRFKIDAVNNEQKIPLLMYHSLSKNPADWSSVTISPDKFYEEMLYLKALGMNTINSKQLIDAKNGKAELPDNPVMVTFDDGYRNNYLHAYPVLEKLNMKAVISIIGWSVGRTTDLGEEQDIIPHFTWGEAKEMADSGHVDIQNHSFNLHNLGSSNGYGKGTLPREGETVEEHAERFKKDTMKIHQLIKEKLGYEPELFTYPYGAYNQTTENALKELGYQATLTTHSGISDLNDGLFQMKRINSPAYLPGYQLMERIVRDGVDVPFQAVSTREARIAKLEEYLGIK